MKKTRLVYGALAILALGMTACSSETPDINTDGPLQQDEIRYLRVNLVNNSGPSTKAPTFEAGTAKENYVDNIVFDFYDAAGNFVTRANPNEQETITWNPANDENGSAGNPGNVGKIGTAIVKIGLNKGQNLPAYVMCYINPVSWGGDEDVAKMQDLRTKKRENYENNNHYFAMNNSCYYGHDKVSGYSDVKISGTPIAETELYTSREKADEATSTTIDIYVERYAAKVRFYADLTKRTGAYTEGEKGVYSYPGSTKIDDDTSVDFKLDFNAEAWTINADAPEMFAVKNFETVEGAGIPTLSEINTYLSPWSSWNDEPNHRSYWSCSPAYFATEFPQVSDQIADIAGEGKTGAGEKVGDYMLKYYSYKQICGTGGNGIKSFTETNDVYPTTYALENTVGKNAFNSLNPKAAVPSVLLVGNYSVTYGTSTIPANTTFYIFEGGLYFKSAPTGVDNAVLIKDKLMNEQAILYVKQQVDGKDTYVSLNKNNAGAIANSLIVEHPSKSVRNKNIVPHRFVTLQIDDDNIPAVYYRPNGAGEYKPVTTTNIDDVNTLLWQQVGVASAYTQGKCYFSMPIFHLGLDETDKTADNYPIKNGKINWKNLRPGDMGLVRNHIYTLGVDAITGLATGIEDLDYPIVPPMDQDEYFIKYNINIVNWRVVPTQTGIILK